MKTSNNRSFVRIPVKVRMLARYEGEESGQLYFFSKNISAGGAFLESDLLLERGTKVYLEFTLPNTQNLIIVKSSVIWIKEDGDDPSVSASGMGIKFVNLDDESRKLITQYIREHLK
ncbi:MAG TPA: TIGR02266 family protein [bacterium]